MLALLLVVAVTKLSLLPVVSAVIANYIFHERKRASFLVAFLSLNGISQSIFIKIKSFL